MGNLRTHRLLCTTAVLSIGLIAGTPAFADAPAPTPGAATSATDPNAGSIADIVVTARRTSEHLQTTPVAVTALDAKSLEKHQIASVFQIAQATPSLSVQSGGTGNAALIYLAIRGNAQNSPNSASDAAVGIYVDGVYYGRPMVGNMGLLDLASAEVLRGTQGTLFGRNTTGGALNMTTVQPDGNFGGYVRATYGNYNLASVEGAMTLPIQGDELSLRVAGRYSSHDAYGTAPFEPIGPAELKYDISARATLKYAPHAVPLTVTISGDIIRTKDTYNNIALLAVNPASGAAALYAKENLTQYLNNPSNFYTTYSEIVTPPTAYASINDPYNGNSASGIYGTAVYDLGGVKIKSISAYRHSNTHDRADISATPTGIIDYRSDYVQSQLSEELQVSGKSDKLDWIVGGMYFHEFGTEVTPSFPFYGTDYGVAAAPSAISIAGFHATSKAAFGQFNYHVTDKMRVTAGVRYTWDDRSIDRHGFNNIEAVPEYVLGVGLVQPNTCAVGVNAGVVNSPNCNDPHAATFKYPAWTLGVDYQLAPGEFLYAKTGGAAMAGGFNTRVTPPGQDSFQPEKVKDVEIGFKGDFLNRRLRTNFAAFYNWRNNSQNIINAYFGGSLTQYTQNAGNIRAYGIEFEGTAIPWSGFELTVSASRLWAHYQAGSFIEQGLNGPYDASGQPVEQAPKYVANIGGTQSIPIPGGEFRANLNYAYTSSRNLGADTPDPTNPATTAATYALYAYSNSLATVAGYGLLNGKLGVVLDNGLEVSIWGKNIAQTHYFSSVFNGYLTLGTAVGFQGTPRTFGGTIGYKF
jgi:iron complex outermembrane receptor protein